MSKKFLKESILFLFFFLFFLVAMTSLDCINNYIWFVTVTVVDSGSKALKFLGLQEDEQRNLEPSIIAAETHQVHFFIDT